MLLIFPCGAIYLFSNLPKIEAEVWEKYPCLVKLIFTQDLEAKWYLYNKFMYTNQPSD